MKLNKLPDEVEQMDAFWFNRMLLYMQAESLADKMN